MAGFRIGRGRADRDPQAQQHPQAPYGNPQQRPYGSPAAPPPSPSLQRPPGAPAGGGYGYPHPTSPAPHPTAAGGPWPTGGGGGGPEGPEYFGDDGGYGPASGSGGPDAYADAPGHTQSFSIGEAPDEGYDGYASGAYTQGGTYRAGAAAAPPVGPRLPWKDLLSGVIFRPRETFLQMRDYTVWGPALIVTFLYGLLAVFGFDGAREDALHATFSTALTYVVSTAVAMVLSAFVLGVVTHTLARQFGGDGAWQPTVGLSMLIMCLTDAPRLVVAAFVGGNNSFVQILGGATWLAAGALFTLMVSRSHDLPWPKALGASAIQLVALLGLLKLGTF